MAIGGFLLSKVLIEAADAVAVDSLNLNLAILTKLLTSTEAKAAPGA